MIHASCYSHHRIISINMCARTRPATMSIEIFRKAISLVIAIIHGTTDACTGFSCFWSSIKTDFALSGSGTLRIPSARSFLVASPALKSSSNTNWMLSHVQADSGESSLWTCTCTRWHLWRLSVYQSSRGIDGTSLQSPAWEEDYHSSFCSFDDSYASIVKFWHFSDLFDVEHPPVWKWKESKFAQSVTNILTPPSYGVQQALPLALVIEAEEARALEVVKCLALLRSFGEAQQDADVRW